MNTPGIIYGHALRVLTGLGRKAAGGPAPHGRAPPRPRQAEEAAVPWRGQPGGPAQRPRPRASPQSDGRRRSFRGSPLPSQVLKSVPAPSGSGVTLTRSRPLGVHRGKVPGTVRGTSHRPMAHGHGWQLQENHGALLLPEACRSSGWLRWTSNSTPKGGAP